MTKDKIVKSDRSRESEILDRNDVPEILASQAYRELNAIHGVLGDKRFLISALRQDRFRVRRVLDVGCGRGDLLKDITASLGVEGIGIDLMPSLRSDPPLLKADATVDLLPSVDVAYSAYVAHHVSDENLVKMIHNVGRSCRRFILLDIVRHWIPLALFRLFISPFVSPITAADGRISFRRAYAPSELKDVVQRALAGTGASFRHSVSALGIRQVVDISYF